MGGKNKYAQSAIEFVISFMVLSALFTFVFVFISSNYTQVAQLQSDEQVRAVASNYYAEIKLASRSPSGFVRDIATNSFGTDDFSLSDINGTAIVVTDVNENQYVQFLSETEFFKGSFCRGKNQIVKSDDYGLNVCCGECDFSFGSFECSTQNNSILDSYWRACSESKFVGREQYLRVACPIDSTYANVSIVQNSTAAQIYAESITISERIDFPDTNWFKSFTPFTLVNDTYFFLADCSNEFGVVQFINQTVSLGVQNSSVVFAGPDCFGNQTIPGIYDICTCDDLNQVRNFLDRDYFLQSDINFTSPACSAYTSGAGWDPIGDALTPFTGSLYGNGFTISNLLINRPSEDLVGLFGYLGGGSVYGLDLLDATVSGNNTVGVVAGFTDSTLSSIYTSGTVIGAGEVVGGIVGEASATTFFSVYSSANITGGVDTGGIAGYTGASFFWLFDSYFSGELECTADYCGGLIGYGTDTFIVRSYSNASIQGTDIVGGLVGYGAGVSFDRSYFDGTITGNSTVGGLVGEMPVGAHDIYMSNSTGIITGNSTVGGFVGLVTGDVLIEDSISFSDIVCSVSYCGGIIGNNQSLSVSIINTVWASSSAAYCIGDATSTGGNNPSGCAYVP